MRLQCRIRCSRKCLRKRALSVHSWFTCPISISSWHKKAVRINSAIKCTDSMLACSMTLCLRTKKLLFHLSRYAVIMDLWMFGITFQPFWNYLEICVAALRGSIDFFGKSCISKFLYKFFVQLFVSDDRVIFCLSFFFFVGCWVYLYISVMDCKVNLK